MLLCRSLLPPAGLEAATNRHRASFPFRRVKDNRQTLALWAQPGKAGERPMIDPRPHPQRPAATSTVRARFIRLLRLVNVAHITSRNNSALQQMRLPKPECCLNSADCGPFAKMSGFVPRRICLWAQSRCSGRRPVYRAVTLYVAFECRLTSQKYAKNEINFCGVPREVPFNRINNLDPNRGLGAKRASALKSVKRGLQYTIDQQNCQSRNVKLNQQRARTACAPNAQKRQVGCTSRCTSPLESTSLSSLERESSGPAPGLINRVTRQETAAHGRLPTAYCLRDRCRLPSAYCWRLVPGGSKETRSLGPVSKQV